MLREIYRAGINYKKAGVMLSQLIPRDSIQLNAFDTADRSRESRAMKVLDQINRTHGTDVLRIASAGTTNSREHWQMRSKMVSKQFTTKWGELFVVNV
jgi:DNA polymerase V